MFSDHEKIISYACRELKLARQQIADKFKIPVDHIEPDHIKELWLEHLRRRH